MDSSGKRLGAAIAVMLLLVGLNVALVVTGVADGVYESLSGPAGSDRTGSGHTNMAAQENAKRIPECVYAQALRQRMHAPAQRFVTDYRPSGLHAC